MLRVSDADWELALLYRGQPDWDAAHSVLGPAADSSAVVVSSSELKSMYYLHRSDVLLSVDLLGDPRKPGAEFSTFRKLARPVVSTDSVARRAARVLPDRPARWPSTGSGEHRGEFSRRSPITSRRR